MGKGGFRGESLLRNHIFYKFDKRVEFRRHAESGRVDHIEFNGSRHPLGKYAHKMFFPHAIMDYPVGQDCDSRSIQTKPVMDNRIAD